jgi:hypothetical protein
MARAAAKLAARVAILAALILVPTVLVAHAAGWLFISFPGGLSVQREGYACVVRLNPPGMSCGERE